MQSQTNFISANMNWLQDDFNLDNDQETCSTYAYLQCNGRSGYAGILQAAPSVPNSPNIVFQQDTSSASKALLREPDALRPEVRNGAQVDVTYLSRLPGCSSEPQDEKLLNQSSNCSSTSLNVDSLSNTFLQLDLMRNVRQQFQLPEVHPHNSVNKEGSGEGDQEEICLQQPALLLEEQLRKSKEALELQEVRMSRKLEMEEWQGYQDQQDLRQQALSRELELRWYKHKVLQLRSRVKSLLQEKLSMGKQIEKMDQILSKQKSPMLPGASFIRFPSVSTPNSLTADVPQNSKLASTRTRDRDLKVSRSRVDLHSKDPIYQDMYYTNSATSRWHTVQEGLRTEQACSSSSSFNEQAPKSFLPSNLQASGLASQPRSLLTSTADKESLQRHEILTSDCMSSAHDQYPHHESNSESCQPVNIVPGLLSVQKSSEFAVAQVWDELPVQENSCSGYPRSEFSLPAVNSKNSRVISSRMKEKSVASDLERSKATFYAQYEKSSSGSGSNQDSSPGSPSPVRPQPLFWEDAENLIICSPEGISHQGQIKTELCKNWEEYGDCPYSVHCRFAHGVGELRPVLRHPLYKTQICRMLMEGKKCIYNHRCHFRHSLTEEEISLIATLRKCSQSGSA